MTDLDELLRDQLADSGVLGASLAVLADGEIRCAAVGLADAVTGAPMRTDALCLVGSTTKVYTATLVMQLVGEGRVDLDEPVRRYLPGFALRDPAAADALTVRDLLRHTTGIGVGAYAGYGTGEDAVARYVASLAGQPSVHAPGDRWGYSNAGYVIAGRIVEVLTGQCWDDALRTRLLDPAGLTETVSLPEEQLLRVTAKPHLTDSSGTLVRPPVWGAPGGRSLGPTGATLAATAADLVRFGALHLSGSTMLAGELVAEMQVRQAAVPDAWPMGDGWCLGWYAGSWGSQQMRGHTGHVLGAGSHLMLLPDAGGAMALTFNSVPGDARLAHEVLAALASELFGAKKTTPWLPRPHTPVPDLDRYAGTYTTDLGTVTVSAGEGVLQLTADGLLLLPDQVPPMHPITDRAFGSGVGAAHAAGPPPGHLTPEIFFEGFDEAGRPDFLYVSVFPFRRDLAST